MKKKDRSKDRTQRYRERLTEKHAAAAEASSDLEQCAKFDLRFFGEQAFNKNAESASAEIHIHRQMLRALGKSDVQPGETLRQLSKRVWLALLGISDDGYGEWVDGKWIESDDRWMPMFNPGNQTFDGGPSWQGYMVPGAAKPDWFETHWVPPADCQNGEADQPIVNALPKLPPAPTRKLEVKPERKVELPPSTVDAPLVTGYETPLEEQNKFSAFGTFGMKQTSHL